MHVKSILCPLVLLCSSLHQVHSAHTASTVCTFMCLLLERPPEAIGFSRSSLSLTIPLLESSHGENSLKSSTLWLLIAVLQMTEISAQPIHSVTIEDRNPPPPFPLRSFEQGLHRGLGAWWLIAGTKDEPYTGQWALCALWPVLSTKWTLLNAKTDGSLTCEVLFDMYSPVNPGESEVNIEGKGKGEGRGKGEGKTLRNSTACQLLETD